MSIASPSRSFSLHWLVAGERKELSMEEHARAASVNREV